MLRFDKNAEKSKLRIFNMPYNHINSISKEEYEIGYHISQ